MTADELRTFCLALPGAAETFPFSPEISVFKASNGKIFALTNLGSATLDISVKCEPEIGESLRRTHRSIVPGYHLNKRHWITVPLGAEVDDTLVRELIEDSYDLVKPK